MAATRTDKVTGEWFMNASIFPCHDAFVGRLVFAPDGQVVYMAAARDIVGRGVGAWAANRDVFGFQVEIFQHVATSAKHVHVEPLRFCGLAPLPPAQGLWTGEWCFTPWSKPSRPVGTFQCRRSAEGVPLPSTAEAAAPAALQRESRASMLAALCRQQEAPPMLEKRWLPHRIAGDVPDLHYVRGFFEPQQVEELQRVIEANGSWEHMATRSTQEFGCGDRCPCGRSMTRVPLPKWLDKVALALHTLGAFHPVLYPANNARLNAYERSQGIHPHMDGPAFYPRVAMITLGSPCIFDFYPREELSEDQRTYAWDDAHEVPAGPPMRRGAAPRASVLLEPGSLLVFSGDAFVMHRHGVRACDADEVTAAVKNAKDMGLKVGDKLRRGRRVSLTFRHVLPRCQCPNVS